MEKLHEVAGRVKHERLPAAFAGDHVTAELHAGAPQSIDRAVQVIDLQLESVPATGFRLAAIAQGLAGAASASWRIQQQPQRIADHSYSAQRRQTLTDTIAAGVSDGQFPERVDPEAASAALSGAVFYRRLMTADESNDDFIAQLIDTVLG